MRIFVVVLALCATPLVARLAAAAPGSVSRRCKRDVDCRFAFRNPCERRCPPCGQAWRRATNGKAYREWQQVWAIKVPACRSCKACKTHWRGDRAVCRKGLCAVEEKGPVRLTSYVGARIGAQVYQLEVRWMPSMGRLVPAGRLKVPPHQAVALELHGFNRASMGPRSLRADAEIILTRRQVLAGKGRHGRVVFHGRVLSLRWIGAKPQPLPMP